MSSPKHPQQAIDKLRGIAPAGVDLAMVLGSGLGDAAGVHQATEIPVSDLPGYPHAGVPGHAGTVAFAEISGLRLMIFKGRIHVYERGSVAEVLAPVQIAHELGARILLLTNAAGGIHRSLKPGDLMLIEDLLDFSFRSLPPGDWPAARRPVDIFDRGLLRIARQAADSLGLPVHEGVYAGVLGPTYETAAEISMLSRAGADAVGMSTVLEAQEAVRRRMRVMGLSLITNRATGTGDLPPRHDEVTAVGRQASDRVAKLLGEILGRLAAERGAEM